MNKEYIKKIHNWIEDNLEIYNAYTFKTEKCKPKDFTITDNGVINYLNKKYKNNIILVNFDVTYLPYKFRTISCHFRCCGTKMVTLQNCPIIVNGSFSCNNCNNLINLEGAPRYVKDNFQCYSCNISTLKGAPKFVLGSFDCSNCNNLINLEGSPKYVKNGFQCYSCKNLKSLKGISEYIEDSFNCTYCSELQSLKYCPKNLNNYFMCTNCSSLTKEGLDENDKIYCHVFKCDIPSLTRTYVVFK